eukprot:jgi/Mesvir1/20282/Mv19892-RA.1
MVTSRREAAREDDEDILQIVDRFGNCYNGDVVDGRPHGKGVLLWSNGARYVGAVVQGEMEGTGRLQWPDGSTYSGQWLRGRMHGQGKLEIAGDGGSYEGGFACGLFHGKGYRRFANGDEYRGSFCEGQLHGVGEFVHKASQWRCRAEWEAGEICGMGRAVWADGLQYVGQWLHGKPEGYGSLVWPNGASYEGDMADGLPHGFGTKQFVNGARYVGLFSQGDILHQPSSSSSGGGGGGSGGSSQRVATAGSTTTSNSTGSPASRVATPSTTPVTAPLACARDPDHAMEVQKALLAMSLRSRGWVNANAGSGWVGEWARDEMEDRVRSGGGNEGRNDGVQNAGINHAFGDSTGTALQAKPLPVLLRDEHGFPLSIMEYPDGSWFQGYVASGMPLPGPGRRVFENGASLEGTFIAAAPSEDNDGGSKSGAPAARGLFGRRVSSNSNRKGDPSGASPAAGPKAVNNSSNNASNSNSNVTDGSQDGASNGLGPNSLVGPGSGGPAAAVSSGISGSTAASTASMASSSAATPPTSGGSGGTSGARMSGSPSAPRPAVARLVLTGEGVRCWADGSTYEGMLQEGRPVGKGRFTWGSGPDSWSFVGRVSEETGVVEGWGKLTWRMAEHGRCSYEGDFQQGLFHGQGEVHFGSGGLYRGEFYHGMYHGKGVFIWPSGLYGDGMSCSYSGTWARDQMQGQGRLEWVDGDYLEGTFKDGQLVKGKGRRTLACGDVCEGGWVAGSLHGYAEYNWKDGSYYLGGVDRGKHSGYGKKVWASGEMYVGHFSHGQEDGQGVLFDKLRRRRVLGRWKEGTLAEEIVEKVCDPTSDGTVYLDMSSGSAKPWGGGTGHAIVIYTKKGDEGVYVGTLDAGRREGGGILVDAQEVVSIGQWCQDELQRTADCLYGQ